jgi:hypothetical protein
VNAAAYWVSSITDYSSYGTGSVGSPDNIIGATTDDQYAGLYAGNYGDQAMIVGELNEVTHGDIYLYGYSVAGYYSHLYVYVSYNGQNWYQVSSQTVNPGSADTIDCGSYANDFVYIAIVVYDDQGLSGNMRVDAVSIVP